MPNNDLVTLAEVKGLLKFEHDSSHDDVRLSLLIGSCSESILRFIKSDGDEFRDSDGNIVTGNVPDDIKLATAAFVGIMDRYPDGDDDKLFKSDYLPAQVESILHSRREPTIA